MEALFLSSGILTGVGVYYLVMIAYNKRTGHIDKFVKWVEGDK